MRLFIYQLDGYVGSTLAKRCAEEIEECEVIGTATDPKYRRPKYIQRIIDEKNLSEMKTGLLTSDVIVYELEGKPKEVTSALKVLLRHDYEEEKVLIGISSLMSWVKTGETRVVGGAEAGEEEEGAPVAGGEEEDETSFNWEKFAERKPHPNYKANLTSENVILTKGNVKKPMLRTYIVWPGVLYGNGEGVFHSLFKCAWHCSESLPLVGNGNNIIPTIHVHDLAGTVMSLMQKRPDECQGYVAVDSSKNTLTEIVTAISKTLSNGVVVTKTHDEYLEFMTEQNEPHANSLMLQLNLRMEFSNKEDLGIEWRAESGLVENISTVVEEYREYRTLQPMRVVMYGPPMSGKSFYARELAEEYELPILSLGEMIPWALEANDDLSTLIKADLNPPEEEPVPAKKAPPKKKTDEPAAPKPPPRITDETLAKIVRKRIWLPDCRNQGWILDGFPKTHKQAALLFKCSDEPADDSAPPAEGEGEGEGGDVAADEVPSWEKKVAIAEVVVALEATDELLRERVMGISEDAKAGTHNTEDGFNRRLATFKATDTPEVSPIGLLQDNKVRLLNLPASEETQHALDTLRLTLGNPRNYHPSRAREERERRHAEQVEFAEWDARRIREEAEAEERNAKNKILAEERERVKELAMQERAALDTRSLPLRKYLMDNVLPILTKGLLEVSKARPADPVDHLAEFLFKQDPEAA